MSIIYESFSLDFIKDVGTVIMFKSYEQVKFLIQPFYLKDMSIGITSENKWLYYNNLLIEFCYIT